MKFHFIFFVGLFLIAAQVAQPIAITSPLAGAVLRGEVTITGRTDISNFLTAQLDFTYASNQTGNWFTIQTLSQPSPDSTLAIWNTSAISDGDYILRLRVNLNDGSFQDVTVSITIQNDSLPPTPTIVPTATPETILEVQIPTPFLLAASPTPTNIPRPTPVAFPTNRASLNSYAIYMSLGRGALVIIGLFIFAGLIIRIRRS